MLPEKMVALGTNRNVIRELYEFGKQRIREVGAENVFDFTLGNPNVPPPESMMRAVRSILEQEDPITVFGYTSAPGDLAVRSALAGSLSRRFDIKVGPDNLYLTAGAAAAIDICLHALTVPGDEFIVFAPYFPEYKVFIERAGGKMVLLPPDTEQFQILFPLLEAAITSDTKGIIINSPNNPSGAVYSEETIRKLAKLLRDKAVQYGHPIYLISDEPYREIVYDGFEYPWLTHYYDDTLICYSYSKSLSMPGSRIGYILVPDSAADAKTVYAAVLGAGRALGYVNAPSLFQRVIARCDGDTADLDVYRTNRDLLYNGLIEAGFSCLKPGGAFYLFPRSLEPDDLAFCERAKKYDLLVVPGSGFGCPGFVRLAYCVSTDMIRRSLPALRKLASEYRRV